MFNILLSIFLLLGFFFTWAAIGTVILKVDQIAKALDSNFKSVADSFDRLLNILKQEPALHAALLQALTDLGTSLNSIKEQLSYIDLSSMLNTMKPRKNLKRKTEKEVKENLSNGESEEGLED